MKPAIYAVVALFLYATQNVVLEQKFNGYSTVTILLCMYAVMLPAALIQFGYMHVSGQAIVAPNGMMILVALGVGLVYYFADYFFIGAYTQGGSVTTITTIVIMLPVFASIVKFFWVGGLPNGYQIGGYALAVGSVFLIIKGSS